jgi:hypothetical protein
VFILILGLVLVICLWVVADVEFRYKLLLTALYLATFGLLFLPEKSYLFVVGQCVMAAVNGVASFGMDFLGGRR